MSQASQRMPLIDCGKAIASQLIVLHHLSSYGPLAGLLQDLAPRLADWLFEYGRMAVQVFLVIAGFLAARGLSPQGQGLAASPLPLFWKRYQRLVVPFLAAIGMAIICAAIADRWLDDDMVPARATLGQWLAHALLLHGVLGVESLSAGVWYVAIDFQLFVLMALLLWVGRRRGLAIGLVLSVGIASLFHFNRDAGWDNWAIYFFGSYTLGAAAWWASDRRRLSAWLGVIACVTIAALLVDFRLRIALALGSALVLGFARRTGWLERWPQVAPLDWLGRISYSVFLIHFPVLLLANTIADQFEFEAGEAVLFIGATWAASVAAGALFYRLVESPEASRRIAGALGTAYRIGGELLQQAPRLLRRMIIGRT